MFKSVQRRATKLVQGVYSDGTMKFHGAITQRVWGTQVPQWMVWYYGIGEQSLTETEAL